jgi:hypothetical protein
MTEDPKSKPETLAEVWARVGPTVPRVEAVISVDAASRALPAAFPESAVLTERMRREIEPMRMSPIAAELARALNRGWEPPLLRQVQQMADYATKALLPPAPILAHVQQMQNLVAKTVVSYIPVLAQVQEIAAMVSKQTMPTAAWFQAIRGFHLPTLVPDSFFASLSSQFLESLRVWGDLAARGSIRGRRALAAAREARRAFLNGVWEPLEAFVRTWLGLQNPRPDHLEAAADALLSEDWDDPEVLFDWLWDVETLTGMRARVIAEARWHRPLHQGQILGRSIGMLDAPLRRNDPDAGSQLDLVPAPTPPDPLGDGIEDQRLARALRLMTPEERAVCLAKADGARSWEDAAITAGFPARFGESVRRKRGHIARRVCTTDAVRHHS